MKKGEYYRHKWNKYVSKIISIHGDAIELKTINSGVTETIDRQHFNNNYEPCITIYQWRKTIESAFADCEIHLMGDCVRANKDTTIIDFSISNDKLVVCVTDDIKKLMGIEHNLLRYDIDDAEEIINSFASLI